MRHQSRMPTGREPRENLVVYFGGRPKHGSVSVHGNTLPIRGKDPCPHSNSQGHRSGLPLSMFVPQAPPKWTGVRDVPLCGPLEQKSASW